LVLGGCGGSSGSLAVPQTVALHWRERIPREDGALVVRVERLVAGNRRWAVDAAIVNHTSTAFLIGKPHAPPGATLLGVATDEGGRLAATEVAPALPRLDPGERWRGRFSGPGRLPSGRPIHVSFGQFIAVSGAVRFSWLTDHAVRLR
jgi:hypothetical protein